MRGFEFFDANETGHRGGAVLKREIVVDGFVVRRLRIFRLGEYRLEFGGEDEHVIVEVIFERFLANTVAGAENRSLPLVIDGESEHAAEVLETRFAVFVVERHDDFGVGTGCERVAFLFQCVAMFLEIVDLSVEDDPITIHISHGLVTERGEIDDGKPAMSESDMPVGRDIDAAIVRAAMSDGLVHCLNFSWRYRSSCEGNFSGYAAHRLVVITVLRMRRCL